MSVSNWHVVVLKYLLQDLGRKEGSQDMPITRLKRGRGEGKRKVLRKREIIILITYRIKYN